MGSHQYYNKNKRPPHLEITEWTFSILWYTIVTMSKQIKVSDPLYQRIKDGAERNYRTISGHLEYMIDQFDRLKGTPAIITPPPKKPDVSDLLTPEKISPTATPPTVFHSSGEEKPCCANELRPCAHWVWDTESGEGYRNMLSGRFMEVE